MDSEPLIECEFFIPIRRDKDLADGELHQTESWDWLTGELLERFTGMTLAPGFYEGAWKNPKTGAPVTDQSRKYTVALPESRLGDLRALLAGACGVFRQQCVYLSVAGRVEFVEGVRDEPG